MQLRENLVWLLMLSLAFQIKKFPDLCIEYDGKDTRYVENNGHAVTFWSKDPKSGTTESLRVDVFSLHHES